MVSIITLKPWGYPSTSNQGTNLLAVVTMLEVADWEIVICLFIGPDKQWSPYDGGVTSTNQFVSLPDLNNRMV